MGFDLSELMMIMVVALIVIGPERLPKVARTMGLLYGRAQRYVNGVKADITRDLAVEEYRQLQQKIQAEAQALQQTVQQTGQTVDQQVQKLNRAVANNVSGPITVTAQTLNEEQSRVSSQSLGTEQPLVSEHSSVAESPVQVKS